MSISWNGRLRASLPGALVALAALLRAAALVRAPVLTIDESRYLVVSHHLRHGLGYTNWDGPETHVHPLHPALAALAGASLESLEARGRSVTFLASILLLVPVGLIAERLGGRLAALLALFLMAVHPWLVRASPSVQPESLYVLLVACALLILLDAVAARGHEAAGERAGWRFAAAGLLFGLAYLARPEGILVGLLGGGIAFLQARRARTARFIEPAVFVLGRLLAAAPYLWFLRRVTGEWTLTGKTAFVFFVDQSIHVSRDLLDAPRIHGDMMARYGGVLPYVAAHPAVVLASAARNGAHICFDLLPRALGPVGLLGLFALAVLLVLRRSMRPGSLLIASPCLTLVLLLLTYSSDRVAGTTLPFLLVLASLGLAAALESAPATWKRWRRALLLPALASLALAGWTPAAWRAWTQPSGRNGDGGGGEDDEARLVARVIARAAAAPGGQEGFITNNVVLSFYARDPRMFGPPGRYRSFRFDAPCAAIVTGIKEQGMHLAILDLNGFPPPPDLGDPACPLRPMARVEGPTRQRVVLILALS